MTTNLRDINVYAITNPDPRVLIRDVNVYAIVAPPPVVEMRTAGGYAIINDQQPIALRSVGGYALMGVVKAANFTLSGQAGLLAAINKEQGRTFVAADFVFATPQVTDAQDFFNTSILLTATAQNKYRGTFTFNYHRYTLAEVFGSLTMPAVVGTTIYNTLAAINAKCGLALDQTDVLDAVIPAGAKYLQLVVKPTSIYYQAGTSVFLGTVPPSLSSATPTTNLNGFDAE